MNPKRRLSVRLTPEEIRACLRALGNFLDYDAGEARDFFGGAAAPQTWPSMHPNACEMPFDDR